jgi:predicted nucleotide-binding protein (sugar kinase/HSP70/actin superfamily)
MIKKLKCAYPWSNIVPIDYDAGMSEVNQINRIKLMLTNAVRNMKLEFDTALINAMEENATDFSLQNMKEVEI